MDIESIGIGGGGGVLGALAAFFGFKHRLDAQDKRIESLEKDAVYKDSHAECSRAWHESLASIDRKMDILLSKIGER